MYNLSYDIWDQCRSSGSKKKEAAIISLIAKILTVVAIFLMTGCRTVPESSGTLDVERQTRDCSLDTDPGKFPSYYTLKSIYSENKFPDAFKSKEALLQFLPESLRRNFVLFYKTESLDKADYATPRVIFFDNPEQPRFFVGIDATDKGKFEIMEYQERARTFCFHEIAISAGAEPVFKDHPPNCVNCHKSDERPLWESFNTWPRLYGSRHGLIKEDSQEGMGFKKFITESRATNIYKYLVGPTDLFVDEGNGRIRFINEISGEKITPHSKLTSALVRLNNQRLARILGELVRDPGFSRYKYAILGALAACPNIDLFVPADLKSNHTLPYEGVLKETRAYMADTDRQLHVKVNAVNFERDSQIPSGSFDVENEAYVVAVANLRYLLENRSHGSVDMSTWSMSRLNSYHFAAEGVGITDVGHQFQTDIFGISPELWGDPSFYDKSKAQPLVGPSQFEATCSQLRGKSLAQ